MASKYQSASELMARHPELFTKKNLLIAGQLLDDAPIDIAQTTHQTLICTSHFGQYKRYQQQCLANTEVIFDATPQIDEGYDSLLFYIPKAKQEAAYWLSTLLPQLRPNADIFIVGENRGGVNAAPKLLAGLGLDCQKIDSARRCSLFHSELNPRPEAVDPKQWQTHFELAIPQGQLKVSSMPGVFNHGALDQGTELLLAHLPKLSGRGLDFGCGAGIIGAALAKQTGAQMTLVDVSALALQSSEQTLELNGVTGEVMASDGLSQITGKFDFIVTNPPFHEGVKTQYETTESFLTQATQHLNKDGELWVVANSFLSYESILKNHFSHCQMVTDNRKYRIYHCRH